MKPLNYALDLVLGRVPFDFDEISKHIDYISRMNGVLQSRIHHAEGDVWIHTKMVCEALLTDEDYQALSIEEQEIVFAATLLHDIEKYSTVRVEGDHISSPNHAAKGAKTAYYFLKTLGLDSKKSFLISKLVRFHGLPLWLHEKKDPERKIIETSYVANNKLLYLLGKADAIGRKCEDKDDLLYRVEFFKAFCEELDCFDTPYNFKDTTVISSETSEDLMRFEYFYNGHDRYYEPFDDSPDFIAYLVCGLPGSGKDTYIKSNFKDLPVISLDEIRKELKIKPTKEQGKVIQAAIEKAKGYLRKSEQFVWNATNVTKLQRDRLVRLFNTYGAKISITWIDKDINTILAQNRQREAVVPEKVIKKLDKKSELPDLTECHFLKIVS